MNEPAEPEQADESGQADAAAEARRRRRAAVFGEVLPESTSDDRDAGAPASGGNEEWLRANVPPHHG